MAPNHREAPSTEPSDLVKGLSKQVDVVLEPPRLGRAHRRPRIKTALFTPLLDQPTPALLAVRTSRSLRARPKGSRSASVRSRPCAGRPSRSSPAPSWGCSAPTERGSPPPSTSSPPPCAPVQAPHGVAGHNVVSEAAKKGTRSGTNRMPSDSASRADTCSGSTTLRSGPSRASALATGPTWDYRASSRARLSAGRTRTSWSPATPSAICCRWRSRSCCVANPSVLCLTPGMSFRPSRNVARARSWSLENGAPGTDRAARAEKPRGHPLPV